MNSALPRACSPGYSGCTHLTWPAPSSLLPRQSTYCSCKYVYGSRLLPDLTDHLTTQADVGHASPLSVSGKPFRLTFILLSLLVRFTVSDLIEPHASPLVCPPANFFKFRPCGYTPQVAYSSTSLQHCILTRRTQCLVSSVYCRDYMGI